jgi:hypothetical protein
MNGLFSRHVGCGGQHAGKPYSYLVFCEATDSEIIIHAARDPSTMPGLA